MKYIKKKIQNHQGNFPSEIIKNLNQIIKNTTNIM